MTASVDIVLSVDGTPNRTDQNLIENIGNLKPK